MQENKTLYKILKIIYSTLLKILYNPKIYGKENIPKQGPIIFVGNHVHAFDPIMVMSNTERIVHYMAKESLFKGIHGAILKAIGSIKVYRTRSNPKAVIEAKKILEKGGAVGIFPEGTRNRTQQELLKFRHGATAIAKQTNSIILPFAIKGEYRTFKNNLTLEFGKPVNIERFEIEEANEFIRNKVLELLRK